MGVGKIAAQVAHASLLAVEKADKELVRQWSNEGQAKIVLKVYSLEELLSIKMRAERAGLPVALVQDKGLTQVEEGTVTSLGIGPAEESIIDKITGHLRLL